MSCHKLFALIGSTDAPFNSRSVHSYTVILGNLDQMETTGFGSPFSPLLGVSKSFSVDKFSGIEIVSGAANFLEVYHFLGFFQT